MGPVWELLYDDAKLGLQGFQIGGPCQTTTGSDAFPPILNTPNPLMINAPYIREPYLGAACRIGDGSGAPLLLVVKILDRGAPLDCTWRLIGI